MKRSTAISRLRDVADGLSRTTQWPDVGIVEAYVFGALLDETVDVERVELALIVDDDLAWLSRPVRLEATAALLRFDKLPLSWRWRSARRPVWNHHIRRAARFWTASNGVDEVVLESLASGRLDLVPTTGPAGHDELMAQLVAEREVCRRHLAEVTDRFYEGDWRGAHRHEGIYPQDHLWWAAAGFLELDDAIARQ